MDTDKFMTKLCFSDHDVFVDLTLLDILLATVISIYNELGQVITVENIFYKFTKFYKNLWKLLKNDYKGQ